MSEEQSYKIGLDSIVLMRLGEVDWQIGAGETYRGTIVVKGKDPMYFINVHLESSNTQLGYFVAESQPKNIKLTTTGMLPKFTLFEGEQAKERYDVISKSMQERAARHFIEKLGDPDAMKAERDKIEADNVYYLQLTKQQAVHHKYMIDEINKMTTTWYHEPTTPPIESTTTSSTKTSWKELNKFWGKK